MNNLGKNIKHLRKMNNYSQKDLADTLGVSQTSIAHYEAGTRQPTIETLIELSYIFDESIDRLVGRSYETKEKEQFMEGITDVVTLLVNSLIAKNEELFFSIFQKTVIPNYNIESIFDVILKSTLYEIGFLWEKGEISEADEHYASNIVRKAVNNISSRYVNSIKHSNALTFSVNSDTHTLGIEMINTYLESVGINALHLGSNIPMESLKQLIKVQKPKYIFISITIDAYMNNLLKILESLLDFVDDQTFIAVGGQGIDVSKIESRFKLVTCINNIEELKTFINL